MKKTIKVSIFVIHGVLQLTCIKERLLGVDNSRDDAFKLARGRLFLVEAKRLRDHDSSLVPTCLKLLAKLSHCRN